MKKTLFSSFFLLVCSLCMELEARKISINEKKVQSMCFEVYYQIHRDNFKPEVVIGISRGGLVPLGYIVGENMLNIRTIRTINVQSYSDEKKRSAIQIPFALHTEDLKNFKSILIVDDLVDSGKTMEHVIQILREDLPGTTIKIATLFYKNTSCIEPDYYAEETEDWIVFPWEK